MRQGAWDGAVWQAGAGHLIGAEATFEALSDLLVRSLDSPLQDAPGAAPVPKP